MTLMPLYLFLAVCLLLMFGYPVAFTLAGTALAFAGFGISQGIFSQGFILAMPERVFGIMQNTTLIAVPLFVLMGVLLEKSKIAEKLLNNLCKENFSSPGESGFALASFFHKPTTREESGKSEV